MTTGEDGKVDPAMRNYMTRFALSFASENPDATADEILRSVGTEAGLESKIRERMDFTLTPDAYEGKPLGEKATRFKRDHTINLADAFRLSMWGPSFVDPASGRRFSKPANLTPEENELWQKRRLDGGVK
jgi:hypothetical protein